MNPQRPLRAKPPPPREIRLNGKPTNGVPRLALTRVEAAAAIGMSLDSFERYVQSDLRLVRRGRMRLVLVSELERWLDENAEPVLEPTR